MSAVRRWFEGRPRAIATSQATGSGGTIVMPKFSPDGTAQLALVADPEGHVVGLTE